MTFNLFFRFVTSTRQVRVNEGDTAKLSCHVEANPRTEDTIKWKRKNYDLGKLCNIVPQEDESVGWSMQVKSLWL